MKKSLAFLFLLVASVMGLSAAIGPDGNPTYAPWQAAHVDQLYANLKAFDPDQKGLDRAKLRLFYSKMGWNDIQVGLDALVASGRLESKLLPEGRIQVEKFVWKAV